jgi:hypothetical protein
MSVPVSALLGEKTYQIFSISLIATVLDAVNKMNRHYTLAVSDFWLVAKGQPLKSSYRKVFSVAPPDTESPRLVDWKVVVPEAYRSRLCVWSFQRRWMRPY